MTRTVEHIEFCTAAQLIEAIQKLVVGVRLDEVYLKEIDGEDITEVALEQDTLTDSSIVFNLILSKAADPNS